MEDKGIDVREDQSIFRQQQFNIHVKSITHTIKISFDDIIL